LKKSYYSINYLKDSSLRSLRRKDLHLKELIKTIEKLEKNKKARSDWKNGYNN